MRALLLSGLLLAPGAAGAAEVLAIGPGQTLSFHASPAPEKPVSAEYEIAAQAGDWLVVVAPAAIIDGSATEPALTLEGPGMSTGDAAGTLVARLPEAGTYRLAVADFHALKVSRYPAGHPVVEPGLKPEDVTFNPGPLAPSATATVQPAEPFYPDRPPPSGWPGVLQIEAGEAMRVRIFRVDGIRQMDDGMRGWTQDIATLGQLLRGKGPIEPRLDLPWNPQDEGAVAFVARPERLRAGCVGFVRFVARITQEAVWPFERMDYVASGLSDDRRFYVTAEAPLSLAAAPGEPRPESREGTSATYEAALRKRLAGDAPALSPRLAALDAALASLRLPCGG